MNKIKSFIAGEIACLKSSVGKIEYASWWVLRILMLAGVIFKYKELGPEYSPTVLNLALNTLSCFAVTLIRLILIPKKYICRISYRCQTWLNVLVFFASFLGHAFNCIDKVMSWDKLMHLLTGLLFVFIGYELIQVFARPEDKMSPSLKAFTAFGFSNVAIVVWEIFEFFVDYYWPGSTNQAYNFDPDRDPWFYEIFGLGAQNENQWAVFDTCVDMTCAFVTSIIGAVVLIAWLYKMQSAEGRIAMYSAEKVSLHPQKSTHF